MMELSIFLISLCLIFLLKPLINFLLLNFPISPSLKLSKINNNNNNLPPGPSKISLLANFIFPRKSFFEIGPIVSNLSKKYGPLITIHLGSQPTIYITNNILAHQALIQNGAVFADRPRTINNIIVSNAKKIISKSPYGPTWRALRRNLTAGVLHPSQLKSFSSIRKRVLCNLINNLRNESNGNKALFVEQHFRHTIFSLLVLLCFGENVEENYIKKIEIAQQRLFKNFHKFMVFIIIPKLGKFLFRKLWKELNEIVTNYDEVLVPLIRSRIEKMEQETLTNSRKDQDCVFYIDSLLNFQVNNEEEEDQEQEKLKESEMVGLCNEFISAGTDTTSISLQWIMANIVKNPRIQENILEEIKRVKEEHNNNNDNEDQENCYSIIEEDDLHKLPYLKAVILEGLRRHPPGYAPATPHAVAEDVELGGYTIPKGTAVNFLIADIGRDPNIWENPLEFKPERFLKNEMIFDINGNKEIRMIPFGAGRRICPGYKLAMLHLEYTVANLIWNFEWKPAFGEEVDLSENFDLTISMKNPLKVELSPRF